MSHVPIPFDNFLGQPEPGKHRMENIMKTLTRIQARLNSMRSEDDGATAVEYGLIVSLIAIFIIGAVGLVGTNLDALFRGVAGRL